MEHFLSYGIVVILQGNISLLEKFWFILQGNINLSAYSKHFSWRISYQLPDHQRIFSTSLTVSFNSSASFIAFYFYTRFNICWDSHQLINRKMSLLSIVMSSSRVRIGIRIISKTCFAGSDDVWRSTKMARPFNWHACKFLPP